MLTLTIEALYGVTHEDAKAAMAEFNRLLGEEEFHIVGYCESGENEFSWTLNVDELHEHDRIHYRGLLEGLSRAFAQARKGKT